MFFYLQANAFSLRKLKPPLQAEAFLRCKLHISLLKNLLAKLPALSGLIADRIAVNRWAQIYLLPPPFNPKGDQMQPQLRTSAGRPAPPRAGFQLQKMSPCRLLPSFHQAKVFSAASCYLCLLCAMSSPTHHKRGKQDLSSRPNRAYNLTVAQRL